MIINFENFINESYYTDLTPYEYGELRWAKNPVNIGWLDKGKDYEQGEVPKGFLSKLRNASVCNRHKGSHKCPFCGNSNSSEVHYVQGKGKTYIFPQMLSHYISKHGYKPPQEFIDVIMGLLDKEAERQRSIYKGKGFSSDDNWIEDKLKKRNYDEELEENMEKLELRLSKTNLTEKQKDWVRKKMKRKKINPNDGNSNYDIIVPGAY